MTEIFASLKSASDWHELKAQLPSDLSKTILEAVATNGFQEPISNIVRQPDQIQIDHSNLRESISCSQLNARKRAVLFAFQKTLESEFANQTQIKILSIDGASKSAMLLRDVYPYTEIAHYLPYAEQETKTVPIEYIDVSQMKYEDGKFDAFFSGELFESRARMENALPEVARVLKPGGMLVSSIPFSVRSDANGGSAGPSMVGWDIISELEDLGFQDVRIEFIASTSRGIVSQFSGGIYVLVAKKRDGSIAPIANGASVPSKTTSKMPTRLTGLVALPRSGTTLLTSLFAVHSQFDCVYEPWNSNQVEAGNSTFNEVIGQLITRDPNPNLLLKETASKAEYITNLRKVFLTAPEPVTKNLIWIVRHPYSTYLSEVERRSEWWGSDITISQDSFELWCKKYRGALKSILQFARETKSILVTLENLAASPSKTLETLAEYCGFTVEPAQLDYQDHLNKDKVRGDLNVSTAPAPISKDIVNARDNKMHVVQEFAKNSAYARWIESFVNLHDFLIDFGSVVPFSILENSIDLNSLMSED